MMMYWIDDLLEVGAIVLGVVVRIGMVFCLVLGGAYLADRWQCKTYAEVTGTETRYAALSCYVKTDDGWQVWSEYETRAIASEGLSGQDR